MEWIDVNDGLPEAFKRVLVTDGNYVGQIKKYDFRIVEYMNEFTVERRMLTSSRKSILGGLIEFDKPIERETWRKYMVFHTEKEAIDFVDLICEEPKITYL